MRSRSVLWIAAAALSVLAGAAGAQTTTTDYRLHPGDKLIVGVYDDPKLLPQEMVVAPDGRISYPMVGELVAGGKTVEQVRLELDTKLKKYLAEPIATVIVV